MLIDHIPAGSISSLCGSFAKEIKDNPAGNLAAPGCHTLGSGNNFIIFPSSNAIVFSTADDDLDQDTLSEAVGNTQFLFDEALQCQTTDFVTPCPELSTTMPPLPGCLVQGSDVTGSGALMSQIGDSLQVNTDLTLTLSLVAVPDVNQTDTSKFIDNIDLSAQQEQELAGAIVEVAEQMVTLLQSANADGVTIGAFEGDIGFTGGFLKVLGDVGITDSGRNLAASDE